MNELIKELAIETGYMLSGKNVNIVCYADYVVLIIYKIFYSDYSMN